MRFPDLCGNLASLKLHGSASLREFRCCFGVNPDPETRASVKYSSAPQMGSTGSVIQKDLRCAAQHTCGLTA